MSLKDLPKIEALSGQRWQMREDVLDKWNPAFQSSATDESSISILDAIGEDFWTGEGVTAKRIGAALRSIGKNEVVVNINSPGGDFFEGVAIYNMLRAHPAKVTVRVVGLAASAASVIAMAGDEIQIGQAGFLMIHNAWTVSVGNRHDMNELAATMETFDSAMADVYSARTGIEKTEISTLMDKETWLSGAKAVDEGFADNFLPDDIVSEDKERDTKALKAQALLENALRAHNPNMSRSERRALLSEAKAPTPSAEGTVTPRADDTTEALSKLLSTIKG